MKAVVLMLTLAACTRSPRADASTQAKPAGPALERLRPDTISLGQGAIPTLTLSGRGFASAPATNIVRVGPAAVDGVSATADGTTLQVVLPLAYTDTASRGRPTAFRPGRYAVTVETPTGTTNALTLTMVR